MDCSSDDESEEELCFAFEEQQGGFTSRCQQAETQSSSRCQNPMARVLNDRGGVDLGFGASYSSSMASGRRNRARNYSFESGGSDSGSSFRSDGFGGSRGNSPKSTLSSNDDADLGQQHSTKRRRKHANQTIGSSSPLKETGGRALCRNLFEGSPGKPSSLSKTNLISSSPHGLVFNNFVPENAVASPLTGQRRKRVDRSPHKVGRMYRNSPNKRDSPARNAWAASSSSRSAPAGVARSDAMDINPFKTQRGGVYPSPASSSQPFPAFDLGGPVAGKPVRGVHGIVDKDAVYGFNTSNAAIDGYTLPRTYNNAGAVSPLREHMENINL